MAAQSDFVRDTVVKEFIKTKRLRSSADAIAELDRGFNDLIRRVVTEAAKNAKQEKKKTIMTNHVTAAFEKLVGRDDLDWEAICEQILQETPADLGKISKSIRDHIEQSTRR